ncbi:MAG: YggS family pyridoxal phosphate-dependent enzyme [Chromatiales bacterium]|nr:YggS family pyridoxal phosphate-dependent enzyme [Chromatiales bacterium]
MTGITDHLGEIHARIARASARAAAQGRRAGPVTLVAVTKGHPATVVREALATGLGHFGENYLQEALPKIAAAGRDATWHFIGRIQSNKTREIALNFAWAQTVTSARIAERLSAQRPHHGEPLHVCIQLEPVAAGPPGDAASGASRAGCPRRDVPALAALISGLPRVRLRGLMLLPHAGLDAEALRAEYRAARDLLDDLNARGHELDTLSMGMSDDFETAIEEGSTMIRIGTALFGERT